MGWHFMGERLRPSSGAWIALGAGVALYDVLCPKGETLSEGVDRLMEKPYGKALALGAIAVVGSHLGNLIPQKYDPFHYALGWKERPESIIEGLSTE